MHTYINTFVKLNVHECELLVGVNSTQNPVKPNILAAKLSMPTFKTAINIRVPSAFFAVRSVCKVEFVE